FGANINFDASGLPDGATASFNFTDSNSTVLMITTSTTTPVGSYPITITAAGGGVMHDTSVTLTVGYNRIGFIDTGANFLIKEGSLVDSWVDEFGGVVQIAFTSSRIGVLDSSGNCWVKEPGLYDNWVLEHGNVAQIALSNDRIGVLLNDGTG